ncbi:hybrid sensor histidine kinase/response regulator transcription factor [Salinibacter ruber]|uniref:hybrid sensor histidine kinase/response regulator transcription factor n=1 Tax=Salinibacter ruber TaxID=146919 RepID=UPI0021682CBF|nr:hybrid sensor histidine kinase/response regulator transcription factor [Salinibacter ruber]MCS3703682.1 signal transduction histidine kinase/ligand-binding sensor domain-containing protein/DNA-binding response OmpR family regulator [Salinibacter ruber]
MRQTLLLLVLGAGAWVGIANADSGPDHWSTLYDGRSDTRSMALRTPAIREQSPGSPTDPADLYGRTSEYIPKSWTVEDGLPLNMVWALEQSRDGTLWVGTAEGLAAFDGSGFTTYDGAETEGLAGNKIRALMEDRAGRLWIGTPTGLSIREGDEFRQIERQPHIRAFGQAPTGRVWMIGPSGLYRSTSDGVQRVPLPDTVGPIGPYAHVAPGPSDSVWVSTGSDLLLYRDGRFRRPAVHPKGDVQALDVGADGRLWIATPEEVMAVGPDTTARYHHTGGVVRSLRTDGVGGAWVGTSNTGLLRISGGTIRQSYAASVPNGLVHALERDEAGQWWVGTGRSGVVRLRPRLVWPIGKEMGTRLSAQGVFADGRGSVWVGSTSQGLCAYADTTRTCYGPAEGLPAAQVHSIQDDGTGALWVGTKDGIARRRDQQFETVRRPNGRPFRDWAALHGDAAGAVWIASRDGLFRHRDDTIERVLPADRMPSLVLSIHRGQEGAVWIATRARGLARYEEGALQWFDRDDGVPYKNVRDIYETDDGTIWIGTYGGGIARFEGEGFVPVTIEDGLPSGTIHAIREAPRGTFWMTSNDGIFRVPRAQVEAVADGRRDRLYAQMLGPDDGMPARECNGAMHPAMTQDQRGRLWFSTVKGVAAVDPHAPALAVPDSMPLRVTGLRTDGTAQPLDSLELAPATYRVALDFSATTLRHADDLSFRYRLDGEAWTPAHGRRTAEFTSLAAGTHRFEMQATIDGETWYTLDAPLRFTVLPHFYETWWFKLLVGVGLLGLMLGAYRWRTYRLRKRQETLEAAVETRTEELARQKEKTERQAERLQELDEAKNRFFAHVSHEFRTPLSLILSPLRDALQRATDGAASLSENQLRRMTTNAERLQRLIGQLLDLATLEAGGMELDRRPGDLAALVERTAEAFRSKAEQKGIALKTEMPPERVEMRFDPEKVETIVSNLVGNAVKFTPEGGRVVLRLRLTEDTPSGSAADETPAEGGVRIAVADTGPGIDPAEQARIFDQFERSGTDSTEAHEGTGLGLALTSELVELHGGTIEVESTPGAGAEFIVHLPRMPVDTSPNGEADRWAPSELPDRAPILDEARSRTNGDGAAGPPPEETPAETDAATVLVVEDNAGMRAYLREQLSGRWTVRTAADGEEGWAVVQDEAPDLVLSDVMMPTVNGTELCEQIKSAEALRHTPVLLLTAQAGTDAEVEGLRTGADDYVTKPFDAEELRQRIANHLAAREHLRERHRSEVRVEPIAAVVDEEDLPFVEEVIEAVRERLSDPGLTVSQIADAVALSRRQLTRRLKDAVGQTPAAFLRERRIERAKELLAEAPETIAEVAYAVGFRSPSSFSKTFREQVGHTPSEYVDQEEA